jgi:hypothetical protein
MEVTAKYYTSSARWPVKRAKCDTNSSRKGNDDPICQRSIV